MLFQMLVIILGPTLTMFACIFLLTLWKEEKQPISSICFQNPFQTRVNIVIGSGQQQNPTEWLKEYNSMIFQPSETIGALNLRFTRLYNRILEAIRPHEKASLICYYNIIPPIYKNGVEERVVDSISTTLQTCLEYEDKIQRMDLPILEVNKSSKITVGLQLMQDINNRMISFKTRVSPNVMSPVLPPTTQPTLTLPTPALPTSTPILSTPLSFAPKLYLLNQPWCNFCDNHHEGKTCEVMKVSKARIF